MRIIWPIRVYETISRALKSMFNNSFWYYTFKHWYQRARYGFSYRDAWSVDYWFTDHIVPLIEKLESYEMFRHGVPYFENVDAIHNKTHTEEEALSVKFSLTAAIKAGYEAYRDIDDLRFEDDKEYERLKQKYDYAAEAFQKYMGILWD